jgi:putative peptide zinc metalloprotease protein
MKPLALRMRPELVLAAHGLGSRRHWVVEDPVTLKYFRLRDEECSILRMLDGRVTLDDIKLRFEREFAPLRLGMQQLHAFLFRLHELGLVVGDAAGQGAVFSKRSRIDRKQRLLGAIANPLAIRLPGMPAKAFIDGLYPYLRWMFAPAALFVWLVLVAVALTLVAMEFGTFQARLPDLNSFFSAQTAAWFAIALILTKTLHELGHALVSRHLGGSCREIGVMLLVGMPTLYCDVSDAWRLNQAWRRILISAAGMLVELVVAAIATLVWWFSEPGVLSAIALRVMFLCSVSTLLFNANPLARCDGYYILSDLIDVPNLWQESRGLWRGLAWQWFTGQHVPADAALSPRLRGPLMLYAVLSAIYCCLLIGGILWLAFAVLEPLGLGVLAWLLLFTVLLGMLAAPARQAGQMLLNPAKRPPIRRGRAALVVLVLTAALTLLFTVPVPYRIAAPAWIEPAEAQPVYASVPGTLVRAIDELAAVKSGETVATLVNAEIEAQVADLTADVASREAHLKRLRLMQGEDPSVSPQIPAEEKALDDARERLAQWRRDQERLTLRAPVAGTILAPPETELQPDDGVRLAGWRGTPLAPENRGCYLETGQLVCLVGDPARLEAMLVIDQGAVPFVQPGQTVRVRIEQAPVRVISGTIVDLAKASAEDLPPALARTLDLPIQGSGAAAGKPAETYYQARVKLQPHAAPLLVGMHGQAKVLADWQPLGIRALRYLQRTFRIR